MDVVDRLKRKGVKVRELIGWGSYLRNEWENRFAGNLSGAEKKEIYIRSNTGPSGYLWHVFSFEKVPHLKEAEAERTFNQLHKKTCFVFYQHTDYALLIENAGSIQAADFKDKEDWNFEDVYVVDKDFSWTYADTHETGYCGPYFSEIKND